MKTRDDIMRDARSNCFDLMRSYNAYQLSGQVFADAERAVNEMTAPDGRYDDKQVKDILAYADCAVRYRLDGDGNDFFD